MNDAGGAHCGGITPLHDAAQNGHLEVVKLLLHHNVNVDVKCREVCIHYKILPRVLCLFSLFRLTTSSLLVLCSNRDIETVQLFQDSEIQKSITFEVNKF